MSERMKLSPTEWTVLGWSVEPGTAAIVWPTSANDPLYLAGRRLEHLGYFTNVQHSPEIWKITAAGLAAYGEEAPR